MQKTIRSFDEFINEKQKPETRWYIEHVDETGEETIKETFDEFDKNEIQKKFDEYVKKLKPDEELSFKKDDKKYVGEFILTVVNQDGKLMREVTKGSRTFYKPYKKFEIE